MKPFRITSLEAHQIGPFGDLKMVFPEKPAGMEGKAEVHILTGENGTGKSTVLEMLAACSGEHTFNSYRRREPTEKSRFQVILSGKEKFSNISDKGGGYQLNFSEELNKYSSLLEKPAFFERISFAFFSYSGYRKISQESAEALQDFQNNPLTGAGHFQMSNNPALILQWIANNIAKEAIAQKQLDESRAGRYRNAVFSLEKTISDIIGKPVKFYIDIDPFRVLIEIDSERLDFDLLPDGLKSIISWLADLLMRMDRVRWVDDIPVFERNFILFLDEIEVHMHPRWQRKILPAVQGLFPNAQIFISTHSPFVINSVDGAWIHRLVKPNGDSVALEPVLSEDGKSVTQVLDEIFDIREQFGPQVEADLKAFYEVRNKLIKNGAGNEESKEALIRIARKLKGQSTTLDQIVAMEIRQLNRIKQLEINV